MLKQLPACRPCITANLPCFVYRANCQLHSSMGKNFDSKLQGDWVTPNMAMLGREVLIPASLIARSQEEPICPTLPFVSSLQKALRGLTRSSGTLPWLRTRPKRPTTRNGPRDIRLSLWFGRPICVTMLNFVPIGLAEIRPFFDFQDGGHPPSWICCTPVWTTYKS